ncbi:PAS domain-containing protein [Marivirga harenae]|uniref:PAS domain-containing protein n=1 Tax=Marivirga harenae TaxID=2010992 RepID=UPI0026E08CB5|nr:PAS domain-containing protein [Marivirga harenae]WKV11546.1 PAS domain-containing protein [Marivirga harenae]|tara:strand:+ start:31168 stop:33489 length:2322 start_codon:yes stop_codon:yes gene_type:complete
MANWRRKLYNWKIRNLAYSMGFGIILLVCAIYLVISKTGVDHQSILRTKTLANLDNISLPLAPQYIAENKENIGSNIRAIEKILFAYSKGGQLGQEETEVKIQAEVKSAVDDLIKYWNPLKKELYKIQDGENSIEGARSELEKKYAAFLKEQQKLKKVVEKVNSEEEKDKAFYTILLFIYILLLSSFIYWIIKYLILNPIYKISLSARELAKGNLTEKINYNSKNELGYIAQNINSMAEILENATDFTTQIGEGKLDAKYHGLAEDHDNSLATSLLQMREKMQESAKAEKERSWVNEGLAKFADILRNNNDNIEELSYQIISNLVKFMEANQGALFVLTEPDDENEEPKIVLESAYAYQRRKRIKQEISIGEGLVGQSVQEGDKLYLTEVPEDYIEIKSGLGETLPRCVLIVPLKINDVTKGVVEIASIQQIPPYKIDFVEKLGENIASTIANTKTNERTKKLLMESQEMTEQMRSQEEEMRQNMEEMEATQEEMGRAQTEMAEKEANLNALINNTTDSIILIDSDYKIILMNDVIKNRYKGTQYEQMKEGSNALDMLGEVRNEWKAYYDRVFKGEFLSFTIKSSVQGEDSYRHYDIHPIKQKDGTITGASVFSRDITKEKQLEMQREENAEKLAQREFVLNGMINNTDDTFFAINTNYEILVVNEVLKNRFKESGVELKAGLSILSILPKEQLEKWKARYDKALAGEKLRIEEIRELKTGNLTIETRCEPIYNDEGAVIGVSTVSRDITELKKAQEAKENLQKELDKIKSKK